MRTLGLMAVVGGVAVVLERQLGTASLATLFALYVFLAVAAIMCWHVLVMYWQMARDIVGAFIDLMALIWMTTSPDGSQPQDPMHDVTISDRSIDEREHA